MKPAPPSGRRAAQPGASTFYELASAHVASHGGEWFVAAGPGQIGHHPRQWAAWMAYFRWLDDCDHRKRDAGMMVKNRFNTMNSLKAVTIPTEWPTDFDASAPPPPEPREEPLPSPHRRRELAAMLQGLVAAIELREQRAPTWRTMTPAQAEANLGKLADRCVHEAPRVETKAFASYLERMREGGAGEVGL